MNTIYKWIINYLQKNKTYFFIKRCYSMNTTIYDPFSVCFSSLKLKYKVYDDSLSKKNIIKPFDKVNVFINVETVFKNITMIIDLEKKIYLKQDFDILLISNILNLAAHYKRFFVNNRLDTKVYLYYTDLDSTNFSQKKYNDEYRYYYLEKFNRNPRFVYLTEQLKKSILPNAKTYCDFIPNVYMISGKNIEGSLIPYVIGKMDPLRKNFIIGGEIYDTQYSLIDGYCNHYINRNAKTQAILSSIDGYLSILSKTRSENTEDSGYIFNKYPMYVSLLAVLGDKVRSIESVYGFGLYKFKKLLESDDSGIINNNSPETIADIFEDSELKSDFKNNFYCTSIKDMFNELTEADKKSIEVQLIDRLDINSIKSLNNTVFYNHPLILEGLLI